jgi:hypothetical protein
MVPTFLRSLVFGFQSFGFDLFSEVEGLALMVIDFAAL